MFLRHAGLNFPTPNYHIYIYIKVVENFPRFLYIVQLAISGVSNEDVYSPNLSFSIVVTIELLKKIIVVKLVGPLSILFPVTLR